MSFKDYREETRKRWGSDQETSLDQEQINMGCMLRIADAIETVAKDRVALERDLKWYKEAYARQQGTIKELRNQVTGMKSAKSRYKNQLQKLKDE